MNLENNKGNGGSLVPRVSPHPDKNFVGARGDPRKETRARGVTWCHSSGSKACLTPKSPQLAHIQQFDAPSLSSRAYLSADFE